MIPPQLISMIAQQLPDLNAMLTQHLTSQPALPQPTRMQMGGGLGGLSLMQNLQNLPSILQSLKNNTNTNYQIDNSPYKLKAGGSVSGYRKYNAKSHAKGGQLVNESGLPDATGQSEIEKKESSYTYRNLPNKVGETYVFSDANKTAPLVDKIINSFKYKSNLYPEQRNLMELRIADVEKKNEAKKQQSTPQAPQQPMQQPQQPQQPQQAPQQFGGGGNIDPLGNLLAGRAPYGNNSYNLQLPPTAQLSSQPIGQIGPVSNPADRIADINRPIRMTPAPDLSLGQRISKLINNTSPDEAMRAGSMGMNFAQLLNRPEQESLISPNFNQADAQMSRLTANLDPLRNEAARASAQQSNINRGGSTNFQQFAGREAQNSSNLLDNLQRVAMQEQSVLNTVSQTKANYEQFKASDFANRSYQNRIDNLQNAAQNRNIKRVVNSDIMAESDRLSQIESNRGFAEATTTEGIAILNLMYPNISISEDEVIKLQKLTRGEITRDQLSPEFLIKFNK